LRTPGDQLVPEAEQRRGGGERITGVDQNPTPPPDGAVVVVVGGTVVVVGGEVGGGLVTGGEVGCGLVGAGLLGADAGRVVVVDDDGLDAGWDVGTVDAAVPGLAV
jgi:hypothetical protein